MLYYAAGQYENALTIEEQAIALDSKVGAYQYNLGVIQHKPGMKIKAAETMENYLKLVGPEGSDFGDLTRTAVIYEAAGHTDNTKKNLGKDEEYRPKTHRAFINANDELKSLITT